jgi:hypothetical protein
MTRTKIVTPANLKYAVRLVKDHVDERIDEALGDGGDSNAENGTCNCTVIDPETINQILVQANFPAVT